MSDASVSGVDAEAATAFRVIEAGFVTTSALRASVAWADESATAFRAVVARAAVRSAVKALAGDVVADVSTAVRVGVAWITQALATDITGAVVAAALRWVGAGAARR